MQQEMFESNPNTLPNWNICADTFLERERWNIASLCAVQSKTIFFFFFLQFLKKMQFNKQQNRINVRVDLSTASTHCMQLSWVNSTSPGAMMVNTNMTSPINKHY